jgi:hypothetical protein
MEMNRQEFVGLVGCAALMWLFAANVQQPPMPVIGFLGSGSPELSTERLLALPIA